MSIRQIMVEKNLSASEALVFQLVMRGLSNAEISTHLFIKPTTVKFHLTHIYKKLGVESRAKMIVNNFKYMEQ